MYKSKVYKNKNNNKLKKKFIVFITTRSIGQFSFEKFHFNNVMNWTLQFDK